MRLIIQNLEVKIYIV